MNKTLLISTSLSSTSINYEMLTYLRQFIPSRNAFELVSLRSFELPVYNTDIEKIPGIAENGEKLLQLIEGADRLIFGIAEHNGSVTAAFKNTLDWLSRISKEYRFLTSKEVLLAGTSPSARGAIDAIRHAKFLIHALGGKVVGEMAFPSYYSSFSATEKGLLINEEVLKEKLHSILEDFYSEEKDLFQLENASVRG